MRKIIKDWGPFINLAAMLKNASDSARANPKGWIEMSERFSGIWGLYARDIWKKYPSKISDTTAQNFSFGEDFEKVFLQLFSSESSSARKNQGLNPEAFALVLVDCHRWLAEKIIKYVAPLFAPPWNQIPIQFSSISQKAIAWSLLAYAVDQKGPDILNHIIAEIPLPDRYLLDKDDTIGNFLALHIQIEELVENLTSRLKIQTHPDDYHRCGGLRKSGFLGGYSALANDSRLNKWHTVINILISNSPLTQLIYADVIDAPLKAKAAQGLSKLPQPIPDWYDIWISHLARSLIGVVRSLSPFERKRRQLETEIKKAENYLGGHPNNNFVRNKIQQSRGFLGQINIMIFKYYFDRITFLADLFENRDDTLYLHLRMLDMLVRNIFTNSMKAMQDQWRRFNSIAGPHERARWVFISDVAEQQEHGVCYSDFVQIFFGCEKVEDLNNYPRLISQLKDYKISDLLNHLKIVLEPKMTEIVGRTQAFKDLISRFTDEVIGGVELPCRFPDSRGGSSEQIISIWYAAIQNRLSEAERTQFFVNQTHPEATETIANQSEE